MPSFTEFIIDSALTFIVEFFLKRVAAVFSRCWDDQFMINMFKVIPESGLKYMFENGLMDEAGWNDMFEELGRNASTPKPVDEDDDDSDESPDDDESSSDDEGRDGYPKEQATPKPNNANHMFNNGHPMYALVVMGFNFHN